jgi:glycosyltransferase involved in cell wall biosynthesis
MTNSGNIPESTFRSTVIANFPAVCPSEIEIIGSGRSVLGKARRDNSALSNEVVWRGSFTDLGGYANMNREVCLRLPFHGYKVKADVLATMSQVDSMTMSMLRAMQTTRLENERLATLVVGFVPMAIPPVGGRKVVFYTMMETQSLQSEFVKRCNDGASEIWVPCQFYADVFRYSGVVKPIHVLPLGVNQNIYTPEAKEPVLRYTELPSGEVSSELPNGFRFMSLFGWSYRKGPDVLCRSFINEFDGDDDACLVIYSRYMGSSTDRNKNFIHEEIREYFKEIGKENPPKIFHCGEDVPIDQLPGCYSAADCFVFCSRGEGFGLPLIEAGACGIPVISAYHTSMTEFLDEEVSYLVPPSGYAPANDKLVWISEYYKDQDFAVMGEDEEGKFSSYMRRVYDNNGEAKDKAAAFRNRVLSTYTWDECARRVARRLSEIHG